MGTAAGEWAELQRGRGIPPEIRDRVDWNPWHHEPSWFVPPPVPADTPSRAAGLALLAPSGAVLDVGCGGGDAAFALAERATGLTGVERHVHDFFYPWFRPITVTFIACSLMWWFWARARDKVANEGPVAHG